MSNFIDRRLNGKNKSAVNRQRFLRRFKKQIKNAVSDAIAKRSITDFENGEKITIPTKDIDEPSFGHGQGGTRETIYPGNREFVTGDKIQKPQSGNEGSGGQASNTGEGIDDFGFEISRQEFLEMFFDDLALPELIKKEMAKIPSYKMVHAGITKDGIPTNINIVRSLRSSLARRIALTGRYKRALRKANKTLAALRDLTNSDPEQIKQLKKEIKALKKKVKSVPFLDDFDLRYNFRTKQMRPSTQAVMFCIMDVSGSMDEIKKDIAKRFFLLLHLFLTRNYDHIEVVFIRHHTSAKQVEEQEFFYSRETGGTVVSSALVLMKDVIKARYPIADWNIYVAQASDGDNWNADSPYCRDVLLKNIMPYVQYYAYIEILPRHHQSLWQSYLEVKEQSQNFSMQHINDQSDIYPVFRELFKRQTT